MVGVLCLLLPDGDLAPCWEWQFLGTGSLQLGEASFDPETVERTERAWHLGRDRRRIRLEVEGLCGVGRVRLPGLVVSGRGHLFSEERLHGEVAHSQGIGVGTDVDAFFGSP